jgi:hypothetical protein
MAVTVKPSPLMLELLLVEDFAMTNVASIEQAVAKLPPADLAEFRRWFAEFDADAWDAQIEADAAAGKLDALAEEALAEYHAGKAQEI